MLFNPMAEWPLAVLPSLALPLICISVRIFLAIGCFQDWFSLCLPLSPCSLYSTVASTKWSLIKCLTVWNKEGCHGCFKLSSNFKPSCNALVTLLRSRNINFYWVGHFANTAGIFFVSVGLCCVLLLSHWNRKSGVQCRPKLDTVLELISLFSWGHPRVYVNNAEQ